MDLKDISQNKKEVNSDFRNIKSDYFLEKLCDYLPKGKSLRIIKNNKKIQNRLHININDYKKFSSLFSSIEIEIIPIKNGVGNFINIKKEEELFYHIYYNENEKEIKKNYLSKEDKVSKIKVIIDYQVKSFEKLFSDCKCIKSMTFIKFYRNNITNMSYMFNDCSSLKELNLSNFNTNNVTSMYFMFYNCSSLKELNLSKFNTKNVTNMGYMFSSCESLKELNLSNFNTDNVTTMEYMFKRCLSLIKINISNFNTSNVNDMSRMFCDCFSLQDINISVFNIDNTINLTHAFSQCNSLKDLNFSNFKGEKYMYHMFYGCPERLQIKLRNEHKNIPDDAFN